MLLPLSLSVGLADACVQPWSCLDLLESTESDGWHFDDILSLYVICRNAEHVGIYNGAGT